MEVSIIDVFIALILAWAIYMGIKKGPIVHSLSLLVVIVGIVVFGYISIKIADYISDTMNISIDNLHHYIFVVLFIATVWLSNLVADKAEQSSGGKPKGILNISLGVLSSTIKYLFFTSIFLLYFSQVDKSYDLLSSKAKRKSKLYEIVKNIAPATIKTVAFLKD